MKTDIVMLVVLAMLAMPILAALVQSVRRHGPPGSLTAINSAGTFADGITRIADGAVSAPYLLLKKGTGAGYVAVNGATDRPSFISTDPAADGQAVGCNFLGGGNSRILTANGAIAENARVYTAASGKVSGVAVAGSWLVGYSLAAVTTDGDEIMVDTIHPVQISPAVVVATANVTLSALQVESPGVVVSNAGASGTVTVQLPAAVPGARVDAIVEAAQQLRLDPSGTETIALPSTGAQGAAGKYLVADAVGENVSLVCVTAGTWDVLGFTGTWTAEA